MEKKVVTFDTLQYYNDRLQRKLSVLKANYNQLRVEFDKHLRDSEPIVKEKQYITLLGGMDD